MKTSIVVPSKTASLLAGCLGAIRLTTPGLLEGEVGILVVANGTEEERKDLDDLVRETRGQLPPAAQIHAVPDDMGAFYGNLCHAGAFRAREVQATEIVFLNDDAYPCTGWLENLRIDMKSLLAMKYLPGILGCRGSNVSGPQDIFSPVELAARQRVHRRNQALIMEPRPVAFLYPRVVTFACLVRTEDYFAVGGFDQKLPAHNYSDDILSYRFLKAGHHNAISGSFVAHLGSRTVAAGRTIEEAQKAYQADLDAGRKYLDEHCPDYEAACQAEFHFAGLDR